MTAKRLNQYDVLVTGKAGENVKGFVNALKQAGLTTWKLDTNIYQVSFSGSSLIDALPDIGQEWEIWQV